MSTDPLEIMFQCCFCGETVPEQGNEPYKLVLGTEDEALQQLYCHLACLRSALHPSVPLLLDE